MKEIVLIYGIVYDRAPSMGHGPLSLQRQTYSSNESNVSNNTRQTPICCTYL
jgi:hypothetical protein